MIDPVKQYAERIVSGEIKACKYEALACTRHLKDICRQNTPGFPYVWDDTRANRIIEWFKYCRHVKGPFAGQPIELANWQKFDLGSMFGWVRVGDGARRFKTVYDQMARGQAKSTIVSGIALYGMCSDVMYPPGCNSPDYYKYEQKPEVCCIAVDRGQAEIVWGDARSMALASPDITNKLAIHKTKISHKERAGEIRKLSKDAKNKDGGSPCIIIVDEYHDHLTSEVKDKTAYGKGKRSQSLEIIVTTAGEDAENKPCKKEYDIVKQILDGIIIDETYFGMIREIDDGDDPHDESCWVKANPMFQDDNTYSRTLYEQMKSEHDLAYGSQDYSKIRQWLIKRVNRWQVDSEEKYFTRAMDLWKKSGVSKEEFQKLTYKRRAWYGIDLSLSEDLTADAFVFPLDDGRIAVSAHGYTPQGGVERHEKTDRVPYRQWSADKWLTVCPGDVIQQIFLETRFLETVEAQDLDIVQICYDPAYAHELRIRLEAVGYETLAVRQGPFSLSAPTKKLREMVLQGLVVHDGSPVLTWCLSNAIEVSDSNANIKLSKKMKHASARIDLAAALINAVYGWVISGGADQETVYSKRGMRSLT